MIFFSQVAWVDPFELAASLRGTRMALFKGDDRRRLLHIRGPRPNAADADDDLAFVWAKEYARWAELKIVLGHIERFGAKAGGIEFGRIGFEMLMPGRVLPWQRDEGAYAERFMRAHLPLRTNPSAMIAAGTEMMHLLPGALTVVAHRNYYSAVNHGEQPRVHLIVDFKRRELAPDQHDEVTEAL